MECGLNMFDLFAFKSSKCLKAVLSDALCRGLANLLDYNRF